VVIDYGEAQSGESLKDFIHKIKVVLKELRETYVCLNIIRRKPLLKPLKKTEPIFNECNELISIFVSSISTAKSRKKA
jgi:four helix bundle protein